MTNNPLIIQLSSLSKKEMTRFCEYAASPYFNKHHDVLCLAKYLGEIYPNFTEKKCERSVIFKKLFPDRPHHQPSLAIVFSYTLRLFEQFLVVEELSDSGTITDKSLYVKQLRKRNLTNMMRENELETEIKATKKAIRNNPTQGSTLDELQRKYRAAAEQDAVQLQIGQPQLAPLQSKQYYLDLFYALEKLRDGCELHQRSKLLKAETPKDALLDALVVSFQTENAPFRDEPLIETYFQVYNLLKTNDLSSLHQCLESIQSKSAQIGKEDMQHVFNYLQNHCIEQINKGQQAFLGEVFKIYQLQLDNQTLLVNGFLPEWHYKNIVTTGLRMEEREWVWQFMEQYRGQLPPNVAENAYNYNLAAYYYHIGQPRKVLPLLVQVEYTDLRYNLDAKSLLLRTYFDLEEDEALLAHCEAFKQFLKRNKTMTDFQKKGYFNLIRFAKKAFQLKLDQSLKNVEAWKASVMTLQSAIQEDGVVFNKTWLTGKVGEMLRK